MTLGRTLLTDNHYRVRFEAIGWHFKIVRRRETRTNTTCKIKSRTVTWTEESAFTFTKLTRCNQSF